MSFRFNSTLRRLATAAAALALAVAYDAGSAHAQDKPLKIAVLKVVGNAHAWFYDRFAPAGMKFEIVTLNSPGDVKDAIVSGSADFGLAGVAAAISGSSNGEPVVLVSNLTGASMAVISKPDPAIKTLADLKGMRLGLQTGSTQELVIAERYRMLGMSLKDVQVTRVSLGEMPIALKRGDIDAYVGTEPGSSLSLMEGVGKLVEYPYSTGVGDLVTAMMANATLVKEKPEVVKAFVKVHAKATEHIKANMAEWRDVGAKVFGVKPELFDVAIKNISTEWRMDKAFVGHVDAFAKLMLENKLIRKPPAADFVVTRFVDELEKTGLQ